ncbi:MAG: topoisomerase DNA-binding C4 zinc finger domain-containing protein, partial [Flavobacteriaceae bacterium]
GVQIPTKRSGPLVGKCPKCGNNIVLKKSFYGCSNYPECKFTLAEHFRKKKLTKTNVKELLEGKETQDNNLIACKFYHNCGFKIGSVDTMLYANFENNFEKAVFWYLRF